MYHIISVFWFFDFTMTNSRGDFGLKIRLTYWLRPTADYVAMSFLCMQVHPYIKKGKVKVVYQLCNLDVVSQLANQLCKSAISESSKSAISESSKSAVSSGYCRG